MKSGGKEMGTDEVGGLAAADAGEPTETASLPTDTAVETARPTGNPAEPDTEPTPKPGWTRRAFFQAAALGAAAAAFLDGKRFVPSIAWANDLSDSPCTAQDVQVLGTGTIQEKCVCANGDTFTATVTFMVQNTTGS